MKKFLFRRMASVALASALAISAVPAWGIGTVEAAEEDILTIYAFLLFCPHKILWAGDKRSAVLTTGGSL